MTGQLGVAKLVGALIAASRMAWAESLTLTEAPAQTAGIFPSIAQAKVQPDAAEACARQAGTFPNCLLGCSGCLVSGIRRQ